MSTAAPQSMKLAARLARVLSQIGHVKKDGRNDFHKYDYVTESALMDEVRGKLAEAGVFMFTSIETQHTEGEMTYVATLHTFVDEDGDSFSVRGQGQGADKGDKGVYKAITGAMKYVLMKNFLVSTGDDPESGEQTERTYTHREPGGAYSTPKGAGYSSNHDSHQSKGSGKAISEKQVYRFGAIAKKYQWEPAELAVLLSRYDVMAATELTMGAAYDGICADLENESIHAECKTGRVRRDAYGNPAAAGDDGLPF